MGRSHARIYTSIWADEDFLALSPDPQRMFLFLISQPDLEHSGVIALRERRWARGAAGLTPDDVRKALYVLGDARFVVIDEDTEELLVRSLMRWDGVWKQPNVAKAAAAQIRTVTSPGLRAALLEELARLDGADVHRDVESLRGDLIGDLTAGLSKAAVTPSLTPSGTPSATTPTGASGIPAEPLTGRVLAADGSSAPRQSGQVGEGAGQGTDSTPSLTPSGTPSRRDQGMGNTYVGAIAGSPTPAPVPSPGPVPAPPAAPDDAGATAQTLVAEWLEHCRKRPPDRVIGQISRELKSLLDEGQDIADVRQGLARWHQAAKHPSTLASFVNEVINASPARGSRQQETDDLFDGAMQRARQREGST